MTIQKTARAGILLGLVLASLFLFRGTTNLVNAVTVPLIMAFAWKSLPAPQERLTFLTATLLLGFFLFRFQVFFLILYFSISWVLVLAGERGWPFFRRFLTLTLLATCGFWLALLLTQVVLGAPVQKALVALVGGSYIRYLFLLAVQGGIATFLLNILVKVRQFDFYR